MAEGATGSPQPRRRYIDIALECAADPEGAPATLIRAARDNEVKNPAFAAQVALHAVRHLEAGRGYETSPLDVDVGHIMDASRRIDRTAWAIEKLKAAGGQGQPGQCNDATPPPKTGHG